MCEKDISPELKYVSMKLNINGKVINNLFTYTDINQIRYNLDLSRVADMLLNHIIGVAEDKNIKL